MTSYSVAVTCQIVCDYTVEISEHTCIVNCESVHNIIQILDVEESNTPAYWMKRNIYHIGRGEINIQYMLYVLLHPVNCILDSFTVIVLHCTTCTYLWLW